MKKVLYVTTVSRTINAFLVPHIEMLLKEGYEVQCACSIDKPINKGLLEKGVKIYDIPFSRNPLGLGNIRAFPFPQLSIHWHKPSGSEHLLLHWPFLGGIADSYRNP